MPLGAPLSGFIYATGLRFYKCPSRIRIRTFLLRLQVIFESLYLSTSIIGRAQYTNPWVPEGHIHVTCQYSSNSEYTKTISHIIKPLSVLPYGFRILQTLRRLLSGKWSSVRSGYPWWPLCIHEGLSSLNRKCRCPIPFVSAILAISETSSSVPPYLVQSRYRHCHLLISWYSILVT
jgi:hypothetical protein